MDEDIKQDLKEVSDGLILLVTKLEENALELNELIKIKECLEAAITFVSSVIEVQIIRELRDLEEGSNNGQ